MFATCGISPNDIEDFVEKDLYKIEEMAKSEKVVAIGEIGLDYYWNKDNKELYLLISDCLFEIGEDKDAETYLKKSIKL